MDELCVEFDLFVFINISLGPGDGYAGHGRPLWKSKISFLVQSSMRAYQSIPL